MNRRSMFRNVLAAIGCALLPLKAWAWPARTTVMEFGAVGDGVHDDTAALQAALDNGVPIHDGRFRVSKSLIVRRDAIIARNVFRGGSIVIAPGFYTCLISDNLFTDTGIRWESDGLITISGNTVTNTSVKGITVRT